LSGLSNQYWDLYLRLLTPFLLHGRNAAGRDCPEFSGKIPGGAKMAP
jgi:hypothetical protein